MTSRYDDLRRMREAQFATVSVSSVAVTTNTLENVTKNAVTENPAPISVTLASTKPRG
jgi:hypothetical protein